MCEDKLLIGFITHIWTNSDKTAREMFYHMQQGIDSRCVLQRNENTIELVVQYDDDHLARIKKEDIESHAEYVDMLNELQLLRWKGDFEIIQTDALTYDFDSKEVTLN